MAWDGQRSRRRAETTPRPAHRVEGEAACGDAVACAEGVIHAAKRRRKLARHEVPGLSRD